MYVKGYVFFWTAEYKTPYYKFSVMVLQSVWSFHNSRLIKAAFKHDYERRNWASNLNHKLDMLILLARNKHLPPIYWIVTLNFKRFCD